MATVGKENCASTGVTHECQLKCNPRGHASHLTAALTKHSLTDEKVAAYLKWCCVRYWKTWDLEGRNLLHTAASTGRVKLLTHLLKYKDVNVNEKDKESHYTALHRSLFYGHLECAVRLIEQGASILQPDLDDMTPLDHILKDRQDMVPVFEDCPPCEVYVWGTNNNYTLGIGNHQSRANPEPLDLFRRQGIVIEQVLMNEFHSAFISSDGGIWTCGHGQGGRLGLKSESTALTPTPIKLGANSSPCVHAGLGTDHTLLLLENKTVWSFGLNTFHQLGHSPPPEKIVYPKQIKSLKDACIVGVSATRYHSVFWSKKQLFTCGLNGGQLGHIKGMDSTITVPKIVTMIDLKESTIHTVAASDGATVVAKTNGEVYLLYEYQCRKIVSKRKMIQPVKVCVFGGHLDHKIKAEGLREKGGDEIKVIILSNQNTLHLWQESIGETSRCILSLRHKIMTDVFLNKNFVLLVSSDGEAYQGEIKMRKKKQLSDISEKPSSRKNDFWTKEEYDFIKLKRIPHIHRGITITSDVKGRNFAVTQVHPKVNTMFLPISGPTELKDDMNTLLETVSEFDTVHDIIFEVEGVRFPAHRFIVGSSSPVLEEIMKKHGNTPGSVRHVKLDNIRAPIFQRLLCFMYTRDCDFFRCGACPVSINSPVPQNPLKLLQSAAKKYEVLDLQKKLETLRCDNGYIRLISVNDYRLKDPNFDRNSLEYLWDVTLKSEDKVEIKAHKCILVSRLEYFNCMINQGWLESTQRTEINLPIPGKVLRVLMDYLYTDASGGVTGDFDFVATTLVVADQLLCTRLRQICEYTLATMMSLKNATELLQMSAMCNADQLKRSAMEFICLNLPTFLESRSLEILDDSVLKELSDYYRAWLPLVDVRQIPEYSTAPDDSFVEMIARTQPVSLDAVLEDDTPTKLSSKTPKKKSREKRTSESRKTRNTSTGSFTSEDEPEPLPVFDLDDDTEREEAWVKVVNHPTKQQKSSQSKVKATSVEAMKVVAQSPPEEKFVSLTKLPLKQPVTIPVQPSAPAATPIRRLEKEFQLLCTTSEIEFPALNASPTERTSNSSSRQGGHVEVYKKFVKLSQKQRKRLATLSNGADDETPTKAPAEPKPAWGGVARSESFPLADIMKQESRGSAGVTTSVLATSPTWQDNAGKSDSSLSAVMASERRQRELLARMKSKPLKYTQMEDKAMEDLLLLYEANYVTDERITVRRAEYEFTSAPVWLSSRK